MASLSGKRIAGPYELMSGMRAVPTSLTQVTAKDSVVYQIVVANITTGALSFLVQDQQSTPGQIVPTISLAANTLSVIPYGEGVACPSGIKWQAGGAGIQAEIYGSSVK